MPVQFRLSIAFLQARLCSSGMEGIVDNKAQEEIGSAVDFGN